MHDNLKRFKRFLYRTLVLALFAVAAMLLSLSVFWRSSWLLVACVVVASVAALWVPQPFDLIARASTDITGVA